MPLHMSRLLWLLRPSNAAPMLPRADPCCLGQELRKHDQQFWPLNCCQTRHFAVVAKLPVSQKLWRFNPATLWWRGNLFKCCFLKTKSDLGEHEGRSFLSTINLNLLHYR